MAYGTLKADSIVYDSSGSDVSVTVSNIPTAASPTFTGNVTINAQGDLRLADSDSSNYVGFQAPATVSSNLLYTLPGADGSAGEQLTTDGSGTLSWSAAVNVAAASLTGTTMAANVVTSSLTTVGTLGGLTIDGDVTFTGASSNGLWDKSADAFVANLTGTASIATTVTVADESSDTTCFPLFATAATGNLAPKSGTNLTFNSDTGALTATSFVGALTGNVTGNASGSSGSCTGNAATATEATNVTVTANNSTDETVYPLFADGNTGTQGAETDTGLTYNPSSGLLTSTGFVGNLTGNASGSSGSCTGNAAGLTGSPNITVGTIGCGAITGTSTITDDKGNVRSVPTRLEQNAYTLVASDAGKCITADNGVTVPNNVFSAGDVVTIINSATSNKTITQGSGLTMRNVGDDGNTGNVTVKQYAMCTLIFTHATVCFFSTTAKA
tara:strand:+ start:4856 stop:6181 length:1326 start_codon:yes stop_codon:yes gene_type:complete